MNLDNITEKYVRELECEGKHQYEEENAAQLENVPVLNQALLAEITHAVKQEFSVKVPT